MTEGEIFIAGIIALCIIICVIAFIYFRRKNISATISMINLYEQENIFKTRVEELKDQIAEERQLKFEKTKISLNEYFVEDALRRSKSVTKGKIIVHLAPFLVENWLNPSEIVYLGSPVDMISFTNIETGHDIVIDFIEIKTGNSALNKKQRLIRNAINEGRVYYRVVNI